MIYKLNKISNEDATDRATNILEAVVKNVGGLRLDDATTIIGLALIQSCVEISETIQGKVSEDAVMGMIYRTAANGLKLKKQFN